MRHVSVAEGGRDSIQLDQGVISTENLEACIAVAGVTHGQATLMHLTQNSSLGENFAWFTANNNSRSESLIYVIGGMDRKSEHFAQQILQRLNVLRYTNIRADVLGPLRRDIKLDAQGVLIEYFRQWMNGAKEIEHRVIRTGRLTHPQAYAASAQPVYHQPSL